MLPTLNTLVAWACVLQWWIETELSLFKRSRYEEDSSSFAIVNARSCKQLIFFIRPLLWNIQTMSKLACFKCFHNFFYFFRYMYGTNLAHTHCIFDCLFLQRLIGDLQKRVLSLKVFPVVHSCFQIWWYYYRSILALIMSFTEKSIWVLPLLIFR